MSHIPGMGGMRGGPMLRSFTHDSSVVSQHVGRATLRRILGFARPYRWQLALFVVLIALDAAASEFFRDGRYQLAAEGGAAWSSEEMIAFYARLAEKYPIASIEDGLAEKDWDGWAALTRKLGHEPSEAEILQHLNLSPKDWAAYQQAEVAEELASFDELVAELSELPSDSRTPEAQLMVTRSIAQALSSLDEREQKVIQLYYEFDASLKEIAAVLDLTEARISQINKAGLQKMRRFLQPS